MGTHLLYSAAPRTLLNYSSSPCLSRLRSIITCRQHQHWTELRETFFSLSPGRSRSHGTVLVRTRVPTPRVAPDAPILPVLPRVYAGPPRRDPRDVRAAPPRHLRLIRSPAPPAHRNLTRGPTARSRFPPLAGPARHHHASVRYDPGNPSVLISRAPQPGERRAHAVSPAPSRLVAATAATAPPRGDAGGPAT